MPIFTVVPKNGNIALTEEQLKGIFKQNDKNGDGLLSKEELKEAFKHLGALIPGWRASRGLRYADANGDGYISKGELDALVKYAASIGYTVKDGKFEMTIEEFKQWLKRFDADADGLISKDELRDVIRASGGWFSSWKAKRGVESADTNRNGFVDESEINILVHFALKELGVRIIAC
ncbi:hypothetical protein RJ640_020258 [Escallonia rubra]|uniref:EF-hand domain-containing protein n=1 Tax=Escallonia rubra TaxID=112253 RepID=A0AA88S3Z1_9ASTE|nr:hypothetical protein RJ640_020258 [Escallonia rubra]